MTGNKALVIGVDGGTWAALKPYIEEGTMPNLGRILEESAHGVLRSVIPPYTAPAWATFATGVNPGRHGCYYFLTMRSFGEFRPITSEDIKVETFYETLVASGHNCTIINLPVSYPARIDKTVITSLMSMGDDIIHPAELVNEISLLKEYEIVPKELLSPDSKSRFEDDKDLILNNDSIRFQVAKELFGREWDFFFVLFYGNDALSHRVFAEMLSGEGPEAEGAREYFRKLDRWIAWFFDSARPGTLKMIVSDHGFQVCSGNFSINTWLEQNGFLEYRPDGSSAGAPAGGGAGSTSKTEMLNPSVGKLRDAVAGNRIASRAMPFLKRVFERQGRLHRLVATDFAVDLETSRAFSAHEGIFVKGSGEERRRTVQELIEGLNEFNIGKRFFREAARREEIYWGPQVDLAPDITLVDCDFAPNRMRRKEAFVSESVPIHHKDGIWVLSGPDGTAGKELNASLMDIYPTVLEWMGVEPAHRPDGMSLLLRLND